MDDNLCVKESEDLYVFVCMYLIVYALLCLCMLMHFAYFEIMEELNAGGSPTVPNNIDSFFFSSKNTILVTTRPSTRLTDKNENLSI